VFTTLLTVIHIAICLFLILIVLLQQGKGADAGAAFGGGGNTVFGASGADNLLTKVTTFTAIAFMITSVLLATSSSNSSQGPSLMKDLPATLPLDNATESKSMPPEQAKTEEAKQPSEKTAANSETATKTTP
jgi:preprotein translocase subunit SecG